MSTSGFVIVVAFDTEEFQKGHSPSWLRRHDRSVKRLVMLHPLYPGFERVVLFFYCSTSNSPNVVAFKSPIHCSHLYSHLMALQSVLLLDSLTVGDGRGVRGILGAAGPEHPKWLPHSHIWCLCGSLYESLILRYLEVFSSPQHGLPYYLAASFLFFFFETGFLCIALAVLELTL